MSRMRRVVDPSKLMASGAMPRAVQAEGAKEPTADIVRRFQDMIASEGEDTSGPKGEAGRPASEETRAECAAEGAGPAIDTTESEPVLELGQEALVRSAPSAPPTHEDDELVLEALSPAPQPTSPEEPALAPGSGGAPKDTPTTWEPLLPAASSPSLTTPDAPRPKPRIVAPARRPVTPSPASEPRVDLDSSVANARGVRAWLASRGAVQPQASPPSDSAGTGAEPTVPSSQPGQLSSDQAEATAVRWADLLRRGNDRPGAGPRGMGSVSRSLVDGAGEAARPIPGSDAPETAKPPGSTPPQTAKHEDPPGQPPGIKDTPPTMRPDFASLAEGGTARSELRTATARSAGATRPEVSTPQTTLFRIPDQPPGAMRIRVPTADGGTVRGDLRVDSESRIVRLTLAAEEAGAARSMSTAHEMLRMRLAEEGYQLQSYVVRHDGKSVVSLDDPSTHAHTHSDGGGEPPRDEDDNRHEPLPRPLAPELSGDPVIAGWFV